MMNWQEVCEHPDLRNLPFKIELDERGKTVMRPVSVWHSAYQGEISRLLCSVGKEGRTLPECAIATRKGSKVADTAWASGDRFQIVFHEIRCHVAPEICVKVKSPANADTEINEKKALYFENGAVEVRICSDDGKMRFSAPERELEKSLMFPDFPQKIEIGFV